PLLFACSATESKIPKKANSFVLTNINIVDVEHKTIVPNQTLTIEQGKITNIARQESLKSPKHAKIIDGKNGYITPGLIDMHVHMYEPAAYVFALSHGVTHVRIMNGIPAQLKWRDKINQGAQIGSTSTVSSPIISGYKNAYLHHGVTTKAEASQVVNQYHQQGYDVIKAYGNLNQQALAGVIEQAKALNIPVAKHGPHGSGELGLSQLSHLQSFEHVEDIYQGPLNYQTDLTMLMAAIAELKTTGVAITPTLNIYHQLTRLSREKHAFLSTINQAYTSDIIGLEARENQVKRWLIASYDMAKHNVKTLAFLKFITHKLHEAEVPLLVGSDSGVLLSPHGIATHTEMKLMIEAGLTTYDVLQAATINPAKALDLGKQLGKIAIGYTADFIYTTSNPVENIGILENSNAVIKQGNWYARTELDQLTATAIEQRSVWQEFKALFEAL
ncbi:amidohydrolase family protein, partial [Pseudoalteromonas sp.]|uniref:amidohydrolase family protein n=1 Tax=Pseudoalteromonas sp. TaxID=53249 RepID=UPI003565746C